jgi:hypothetical protein
MPVTRFEVTGAEKDLGSQASDNLESLTEKGYPRPRARLQSRPVKRRLPK